MKVYINHSEVEADGCKTLAELLERESFLVPGVAVAVDNKIVRRDRWRSLEIAEGMKLTVIKAVCGG